MDVWKFRFCVAEQYSLIPQVTVQICLSVLYILRLISIRISCLVLNDLEELIEYRNLILIAQ